MKRILAVDHDEITLSLTKKFLENYGYTVEVTNSSKDALDKLAISHYDLILSETDMPGLSGFDMLKVMQKCHITMPLAFLSSKDDRTTLEESKHSGAVQLISKRKDFINLPHIVDNILYKYYRVVA
ncbi:MAG: response regulator [Flavobacteriales bacterium]|nr:response regulator [Flavobacteriales bacterium]